MNMGKEFQKFAVKGNVVDLAAGIIIGGAFGKVVTLRVNDMIMPPQRQVDFKDVALT